MTIAEQSGARTSEMPLLFQHRSQVRLAISHFASIWAGLGVGGSGAVVAQEDAPLPLEIGPGANDRQFRPEHKSGTRKEYPTEPGPLLSEE